MAWGGWDAKLKSASERKRPILLWIYKPHWAPSVFEGEYVEFPKYEAACYEDPDWGVNPDALYDCGRPEGWIKKMSWAEGEAKWPCAYEIVRNFTMDGNKVGNLAAHGACSRVGPALVAVRNARFGSALGLHPTAGAVASGAVGCPAKTGHQVEPSGDDVAEHGDHRVDDRRRWLGV